MNAERPSPTVDLVIPVLNEAHVLEKSVGAIRDYLARRFPYACGVVIADNGSTDGTLDVARRLAERHDDVRISHLDIRGRGRALRKAWTESRADICAYTDVDLSTDLEHLRDLVDAIALEGYDLATGSRLLPASRTTRGWKREFISRSYNLFVKAALRTSFSDAQCGFKCVSRRVIERVVTDVEDDSWFFDTELLALAEKRGYRIKDVPVRWVDDDDSRVKIMATAWEDIRGVLRVRGRLRAEAAAARGIAR